jgi:hypothetical protein
VLEDQDDQAHYLLSNLCIDRAAHLNQDYLQQKEDHILRVLILG